MKFLFVALLIPTISMISWAQDPDAGKEPLWQAGIFAVQLNEPSYPGADSSELHNLVVPIGTYRGKILRADENENPRARFFRAPMSDLDISAAAYFSSDSKGTAREGMPDLDYVGEIGPRWNYWWVRTKETEILIGLPLRSVFSTNFARAQALGWSFTPSFHFDFKKTSIPGLSILARLSFQFLDRGASGYFYNVDPSFVTTSRSSYTAASGYLKDELGLSFLYKPGRLFFTFGGSREDYSRSSFRDSPLLKKQVGFSSYIGIGYDLIDSEERARD